MSEVLGLVSNGDQGSGTSRPEERSKVRSGKTGSGSGSSGSDRGRTGGPGSGCSCCEGRLAEIGRLQAAFLLSLVSIIAVVVLQDLDLARLWTAVRKLQQQVAQEAR